MCNKWWEPISCGYIPEMSLTKGVGIGKGLRKKIWADKNWRDKHSYCIMYADNEKH